MTKKNEKIVNFLDHANKALSKLNSHNNSIIIKDSKYINIADNTVYKQKLSQTGEDARNEARFRDTKLGKEFDESTTPPKEIENITSSLADKYIKDIFDQAFGIK